MAKKASVTITAPNFQTVELRIVGNAPYVQHAFPKEMKDIMVKAREQGGAARKSKKDAIDFQKKYEDARHVSTDGWCGIPALAIKAAMVEAATLVGMFKTDIRKMINVEGDGYDRFDDAPLFKIKGEPEMAQHVVRLKGTTPDISTRAMWREWESVVAIRFDRDQLTESDVANLLVRAGMQIGIGEGRPASKSSVGMGWGTFDVVGREDK